jgi:tartrate dehydratase alpha subunit/fumarate hydratase class I-like protein
MQNVKNTRCPPTPTGVDVASTIFSYRFLTRRWFSAKVVQRDVNFEWEYESRVVYQDMGTGARLHGLSQIDWPVARDAVENFAFLT